MEELLQYLESQKAELLMRIGEHIFLTFISTLIATFLGVGFALAAFPFRRAKLMVMGAISILQTIPSLAMLALLLAVLGQIGVVPALVALVLYALLPIARGTMTGLETTSPALIEAARGIGLTARQELLMVRLPLAMPYIVSGIRVAAVIGVGIATIAAFIGAGGVGQFINRGLFLSDTRLILTGVVPAALLAIAVDQSIALIEKIWWGTTARRSRSGRRIKYLVLLPPILLFAAGMYLAYGYDASPGSKGKVVIGSKVFTEQFILGEMLAQLIERDTNIAVERKFAMGGTLILHQALMVGEIDMYPEYTGTALNNILKVQHNVRKPEVIFQTVKDYYADRLNLHVFPPLGFNNTYVFLMPPETAKQYGIENMTDMIKQAEKLNAAFDFEFAAREDGYRGLRDKYNFQFKNLREIDHNLVFDVLDTGDIDVITGYSTDGRILVHHLKTLEDDVKFFPPYHAFVAARNHTLQQHPELRPVIKKLSDTLDDETMRQMNYQVDHEGRQPSEVAKEFLAKIPK